MKYHGFELDPFQEQAIQAIERGSSVLVSAPTGAGKTMVADYAVEQALNRGKRCIYTSPLKALSNQKYRDFCRMFGSEKVGIMTGDVVIQIDSPLLIMTTEVLRNMLHRDLGRIRDVGYVVFDEMHYLANMERGTVWEECLILLPPDITIIGLSATVKNIEELAGWLGEIKRNTVTPIIHLDRPVPLKILGFTKETGLAGRKKIESYRNRRLRNAGISPESVSPERYRGPRRKSPLVRLFSETTHRDLVANIAPKYLPCLYFIFSRQGCENSANSLEIDLTSAVEKEAIDAVMEPVLQRYGDYDSTKRLCVLLRRGIGYHHAGMFPFLKELVEGLYERKLIKVLYCTSTFALGVNMPAKTAVFDRLMKFDGTRIRPLTALEFFQKAGRAGRRGMDKVGYVIINRNLQSNDTWEAYSERDIAPIKSALNLSYNSVVNLLEKYSLEEIKTLLSQSLWTYQHRNKILQHEELLHFVLNDLEEMKGLSVNKDPEKVESKRVRLETDIKKLEKQRTQLFNSLHRKKNIGREDQIYREIDRLDKKLKELTDQKKNVEVLGFVLESKSQRRRPGRKVRKLLSKIRRTQEQIEYFRNYLYNIFQEKVKVLIDLEFISPDLQLLAKAEICKFLYIQELFVTELVMADLFGELEVLELNALLNCIGQSEKKRDRQKKKVVHPFRRKVLRKVRYFHEKLREVGAHRFDPIEFNLNYAAAAYAWSKGSSFRHILSITDLQEGDIISSFRQTIDILKQLKDVYRNDSAMITKLNVCIDCMDRDVVKVVV